MTLLELRRIARGQEHQECEGCSKKAGATARCLDCQQSLCPDCCQAHGVVKATRAHSLASLAEAAVDPSTLLQLTEKCAKHEGKKLKFYCTQCRQPACSVCLGQLHSGHTMEGLQSVLESKKKEVTEKYKLAIKVNQL